MILGHFVFAQADINAVPAWLIKALVILAVVMAIVFAAVATIYAVFRKKEASKVTLSPQPLDVEVKKMPAKRFSHEFWEERHTECKGQRDKLEQRVATLEKDLGGLELRMVNATTEQTRVLQKQITDLPGVIIATMANAETLAHMRKKND